jgi:tetratricopeptide (TPR) repeat protein
MRKSWRTWAVIVLFGVWPHLGCHQLPANKSVQDLQPKKQTVESKKQELTTAEITLAAWLAGVEALEKERKFDEAIARCEQMRAPGSPFVWQATKKLALIYERQGERDRAEHLYKALLAQNPRDADVLAKVGDLYKARGQWGIAFRHYTDALQHNPDHIIALTGLGMVHAQLGDAAKSFEAFRKVLRSDAEAHCEVAVILKMKGEIREAIRAYELALQKDPAMPRATSELAKLRLIDGAPSMTPYSPGSIEHVTTPV